MGWSTAIDLEKRHIGDKAEGSRQCWIEYERFRTIHLARMTHSVRPHGLSSKRFIYWLQSPTAFNTSTKARCASVLNMLTSKAPWAEASFSALDVAPTSGCSWEWVALAVVAMLI